MSSDALKEFLWCSLLAFIKGRGKVLVKQSFTVIKENTSLVSSCLTLSFYFVGLIVKFNVPDSDWAQNELNSICLSMP